MAYLDTCLMSGKLLTYSKGAEYMKSIHNGYAFVTATAATPGSA